MSKHTPGPWIIIPTLGETAIAMPTISISIAQYRICSINDKISEGNAEANARLIAAAPELLEACKALLIVMNTTKPEKLDAALTWRQNDEKARAMAEKAIAKAEGI